MHARKYGRHVVALLFLSIGLLMGKAQAQSDLPGAPSTMQTVKAGSFVIPMDTDLQSVVPAGQAPFNLKAYGLVNQFLQNGIPVKWSIKQDKLKDEIDFTATVTRIAPTSLPSASINFRGGPFVVPDTVLPCGLSTQQVISTFGKNVAVYRLESNVAVPVRYTLTHRPKIAVFNNGGNQLIHTKILDAAGITNYDIMDAAHIGGLINCYTFVSEPHAEETEVSAVMIDAVSNFVLNGGNFLAQCHAITAYENKAFFVSTNGIHDVGATITNQYHHSSLAISQFHGAFQENEGGSVQNFVLNAGSAWQPNTYKVVTGVQDDTVVVIGAHLVAPSAPGGNIFYLGGHDYSRSRVRGEVDLTSLAKVNALRLYLNASLIPSKSSNGAWANAGIDTQISCDSAVLGCTPTGPPGSTFRWTPALGLSCTNCPNPVARPSVTTNYMVEVTNGCIARDTVKVEVTNTLSNDFSSDTVCSGQTTRFTVQNSTARFFQWNFGDVRSIANTSTLANPTHLFTAAGTYTVQLIYGASSACRDTVIKPVIVRPKPVLSISGDTVCQGTEGILVVRGATTFLWSTGSTNDTLRVVNPSSTIQYSVRGTSTSQCFSDTSVTLTVVPFTANDFTFDTVCVGKTTRFNLQNPNTGPFVWDFGDNHTSLLANPSHTYSSAGTYPVRMIFGISTCQDTITKSVPVKARPVLSITRDTICQGETGVLIVSGGDAYRWSNGSTKDTLRIAPSVSTTYRVTGTYLGNCATDTSGNITVIPPMISTWTKQDVDCFGNNNGRIGVTTSGGQPSYRYLWNTVPPQTSSVATNLSGGTYQVTIQDQAGCKDTVSATILTPPHLGVHVASVPVTCFGGTNGRISLTVNGGTAPYHYDWHPNSLPDSAFVSNLAPGRYTAHIRDAKGCFLDTAAVITAPAATFTVLATADKHTCFEKNQGTAKAHVQGPKGSYTFHWNTKPPQVDSIAKNLAKGIYQVTVTDQNGCWAKDTAHIKEMPFSKVELANYKLCFEKDPPVVLQANTKGSFSWQPGGETTSHITVKAPGTYTVTIRDTNGCISTVASNIKEVCPPRFFVSNSFTPNGDGINDSYTVFGEHFDNFHMFIFNRWGEIIFESQDKYTVWDGNYKGEAMPIGVYPWLITYTGNSTEYYGPYRLKGSVTVVR